MRTGRLRLDEPITCELCESHVASGSWKSITQWDRDRYLESHLKRCRDASEKDRAVYREQGRWPTERRARRR